MGTIVSALLTTVLQFAADWLQGWYAAERAEADRWAARTKEGQMASLKRAAIDTKATATAAATATAPATPEEWNRPRPPENIAARGPFGILSLALVALMLPGCLGRTVYVPAAIPTIATPARPAVPVEPATWSERERILAGYATALEAAVQEHNRRAKEQNTANGY